MHMTKTKSATVATKKPNADPNWKSLSTLDRDLVQGDLLRLDPHPDMLMPKPVYGIVSGGNGMRRSALGNAIFVKHESDTLDHTLSGEAAGGNRWERYYPSIMVYVGPAMEKKALPTYRIEDNKVLFAEPEVTAVRASPLLRPIDQGTGPNMLVMGYVTLASGRTFVVVLHEGNYLLYQKQDGSETYQKAANGLRACSQCYRPVTPAFSDSIDEPGIGTIGAISIVNENVSCSVCRPPPAPTAE